MKVLYLLRYYPTLTETFVHEEIAVLRRQGVDVTIASLGSRSDGRLHTPIPGVEVWPIPRRTWPRLGSSDGPGAHWLAEHRPRKEIRRYRWLLRRMSGFDRIHVHFAGGAAEWAHALHLDTDVPYTVMVHAVDLFKPRPSLKAVLGGAESVLTVADHHVARLKEMGVEAHRVRCGPDLDKWTPHALPEGPLHMLFVGRNVDKKGLDDLLEAWSSVDLPDARLTLITDPEPSHLPPGVVCRGLLPPTDLRKAMHDAHVVVLPCRPAADGDMDGVPVVLMEALATGRPVITTPISGIPELVDTDVGWLVPPRDPVALASVLEELLHHPDDLRARGQQGPQRLRDRGFHLAEQIAGLQAVWRGGEASASSVARDGSQVA